MNTVGRRRSSVFAGLLLVVLGVIFLIDIYDPALRLGHLIAVYWPVLLILWGAAKLVDYLSAQRSGPDRPAMMSGGEAVLLVVLAVVLGAFTLRDWVRHHYPNFSLDVPQFGLHFSRSQSLPAQAIPAGAQVDIETDRGDISVHGAQANHLVVNAAKTSWGMTETSADSALRGADVTIENTGGIYHVRPNPQGNWSQRASVDLNVEAPASANITASTRRGDIDVSQIGGTTEARTANGDVEIHDAGADASVDLQKGDARIAGAQGNVRVTGQGGDVELSNVGGEATIQGAFDGSIEARNVGKMIHCALPWADITIGHLTGKLEADLGDIDISGADGPVKIVTRDKDIDVKSVSGRLDIANSHGDVNVELANPPEDAIDITNDSGDVDLTLPAQSAFELAAVSRSGDVESDFESASLNASGTSGSEEISGKIGASGPRITIATSYGTIHLHKGR
jgi:DUF4097 and DUF4098 domain-containing protein YvlB